MLNLAFSQHAFASNRTPAFRGSGHPFPRGEDIALFRGLAEPELAALAAASREKSHAKDAVVFLKGDRPTGVFAVLAGTIKIACQSSRGEERVIALPGPGQVFGENPLLLGHAYPYMATALTEARLLHVDSAVLFELISRSPDFCRCMLTRVAEGIFAAIDDIEDYRVRAPRERVVRFLLQQRKAAPQAEPIIVFPVPKNILASRLGMRPESFSRSLRDLVEAGLIKVGKEGVRLLNQRRLAALLD